MAARAPKQTRGEVTRARLFDEAVRSFAARGYVDTTVDRIVRAAGVAKGTFFIHFATKEAVIADLVRIQVQHARRARDAVFEAGGSPVEAVRATVMMLAERVAANRELSRAVIAANILSPELGGIAASELGGLLATMTDDVRAAQRARLLDPKVPAEHIAETLMTSYWGAILHFATAPEPRPLLGILGPIVASNLVGFAGQGERAVAKGRARAPAARMKRRTTR